MPGPDAVYLLQSKSYSTGAAARLLLVDEELLPAFFEGDEPSEPAAPLAPPDPPSFPAWAPAEDNPPPAFDDAAGVPAFAGFCVPTLEPEAEPDGWGADADVGVEAPDDGLVGVDDSPAGVVGVAEGYNKRRSPALVTATAFAFASAFAFAVALIVSSVAFFNLSAASISYWVALAHLQSVLP
jgi:hypothetical protein